MRKGGARSSFRWGGLVVKVGILPTGSPTITLRSPQQKIKKSHRMDFWLPLTPSNPHGAGLETYFGFGILPQRKPVTFSPGFRCQLVLETLGSDVKKKPTD